MLNPRLLVITEPDEKCASMRQQINDRSLDAVSISLEFVASIGEAKLNLAASRPDLILLRIEAGDPDHLSSVSFAVEALAPVPIVAWLCGNDLRLAQAALDRGAVAYLSDTMSVTDVVFQTLSFIRRHAGAQQQLLERLGSCELTLEAVADGVICTDTRGQITFLNSAARRLLVSHDVELVGRPVTEYMTLKDVATQQELIHPAHSVIATFQMTRLPPGTALVRYDGTEIMVEDGASPIVGKDGALLGVVMVFHDITEAYVMRAEVDYLAWHDSLTGLPNRFAVQQHLDQALAHAATNRQTVPVLYLDLDKFKLVNDTLGHKTGDELLKSVAERLRGCFRLIDQVGRQGGDEFIVVMAPGSTLEEASTAAARIISALAEPYYIGGVPVHVGCSTGIAMFPDHGTVGEVLLHHADTALQYAKAAGRNSWRFFTHELQAAAIERRQIEDGLNLALRDGTFELFYQPKIRFIDSSVCGCEALLRWNKQEGGAVAPAAFIPCAESSGQIIALGRWVFDAALRQAQQWQEKGFEYGNIAINVSAEEFRHPEFLEHMRERLRCSAVEPSRIQIEFTESVLTRDLSRARSCVSALKEMGLTLAIDDFGMGYSSLSYLVDFPIDVLKIDRSFVHGIHKAGTRQQALLQGILTLAKTLSLAVVAEGIENGEEERFLMYTGCEIGQGYHYSAPVDAVTFQQFVTTRRQTKPLD